MKNILIQEINRLFKKIGPLSVVQIGAHVGNTYNDPLFNYLTSKHTISRNIISKAILIEPVPRLARQLKDNYKSHNHIFIENCAIAHKKGKSDFYKLKDTIDFKSLGYPDWFDQLGSLLPERMGKLWEQHEANSEYQNFIRSNSEIIKVNCFTLSDILMKYKIDNLNILQIDTEGYEFEILKSINFKKVKPQIINYESVLLQENEAACNSLMESFGYKLIRHDLDILAVN